MSINIQLDGKLQKISGQTMTKEKIIEKLGYTPADETTLDANITELNTNLDTLESALEEHKNSMSDIDAANADDKFVIADPSGNIIAKIDNEGLHTTDIEAESFASNNKELVVCDDNGDVAFKVDENGTTHAAKLKLNSGDVDDQLSALGADIAEHANKTVEHVNSTDRDRWDNKSDFNGDYNNLINKPIDEDNSGKLTIADEQGRIALQITEDGTTQVASLQINNKDFATAVNDVVVIPELPEWTEDIYDDGSGNFTIVDEQGRKAFEIDSEGITKVAKLTVNGTDIEEALNDKSIKGHTHTITANASDDDVVVLTGTAGNNAVTYSASHANSGVAAGTYKSVTVDAKGHVTNGSNPTTLSEYGITDATNKAIFNAHVNESDGSTNKLHITSKERSAWNAKMDQSDLNNLKTELSEQIESEADSLLVVDNNGNKAFEIDSTGTTHTAKLTVGGEEIEAMIERHIDAIPEVEIPTETDPTVPAWAKAATKPAYTSSEVGADPAGSAAAVKAELSESIDSESNSFTIVDEAGNIGFKVEDDSEGRSTTYVDKLDAGSIVINGVTAATQQDLAYEIETLEQKLIETQPGKVLAVARAKADADGNIITDTYATKSELTDGSFVVQLADIANIAAAAEMAYRDGDDNVIKDTYATKVELNERNESIASESDTFIVADDTGNKAFEVDATGTTSVAKLYSDQTIDANAATASRLETARRISLNGDVTGIAYFDGGGNISINTTVNSIGGGATQKTSLVGAKWVANADINFAWGQSDFINLNFTCSAGSFIKMGYNSVEDGGNDNTDYLEYYPADGSYARPAYYRQGNNSSAWYGDEYRTIYITGGADIENDAVIQWLSDNGQLTMNTTSAVGGWLVTDTGLAANDSVVEPGHIKVGGVDGHLEFNGLEIKNTNGYTTVIEGTSGDLTLGVPEMSDILKLTTSGYTTYRAEFVAAAWDTIGIKKPITMTIVPTPLTSFTVLVYWTKISPDATSAQQLSGTKTVSITKGIASYDITLTDGELKTNWLGADYLGLDAALSTASSTVHTAARLNAVGRANNQQYSIDSAWTLNSSFLTMRSETAVGELQCNARVRPITANKYTLGNANYPWSAIFAQTTTIQTSDRNKKNNIQSLTDVHERIFDALEPVSYKFNENESGRTHTGFIAQDVKEAILDAGLTTKDFAAYCEWEEEDGETGCGLRYEELLALCVKEIQKLKKKVAELEEKNN